ncbi:gamma-glutamylcyclotransferase [Clostridium estertheticum]|uniref:gamma-glutamylcyclotransferase family protein n=1 Tax=Clostridium estertheticum TaxID=238834 RepID=UPI0013E93C80|nr:gamma-glutamylcyclotransferase family protein [Clostridium estertheticum]MBZ9686804.1 gamma-glutamylcyclotransferase [Clostridium estertheticum]
MNLVFAYGSLTNRMEIEKTLKEDGAEKNYVVLGIGKLENYKLAFTKFSNKWNGGVLDVIASKNDYVLGLVLEMSNRALREIDKREGVGIGIYTPITVSVELGGELVKAIAYTVVNKVEGGVKASEEYVNKVEAGMREEGFPEEYINKYLLGKVSEETMFNALRYIKRQPHAPSLFMIANIVEIKLWDINLLVDSLTTRGLIRQDGRDVVGKYDSDAKYYTVPEKKEEIDLLLSKDLNESLLSFQSVDCVNSDLNHKTKACMNCLTIYKDGKTFCRKCLRKLDDIDTPMLDIIFGLNKKGYKTQFCCSGHLTSKIYSAYFVVSGIIKEITIPDGFSLECEGNRTTISSLYVKKGKVNQATVELEELARKNLSNLRKWVIELPKQLHN